MHLPHAPTLQKSVSCNPKQKKNKKKYANNNHNGYQGDAMLTSKRCPTKSLLEKMHLPDGKKKSNVLPLVACLLVYVIHSFDLFHMLSLERCSFGYAC